jgi:hypothetical protein
MAHGAVPARSNGAWRLILRLLVFVTLAIDAYVHFDLASSFDANTANISEGNLFRIEASVAVATAILVIAVRRWITDLLAFLVLASGFGVLLIYRYIDIGAFGPFPSLYEPIWYTKKTLAAVAEGVGMLATIVLVLMPGRRLRRVR